MMEYRVEESIPLEPQRPTRQQHPLANYQFSSDELRVLRECNTESFFERSLPLGTSFGLASYFAVKRGILSPNLKYGAAPKVIVSVIVGYFMGKFSYQRKCAEKIMQLPNSKLAELLRQRQRGSMYSSLTPDQGLGAGFSLSPFSTPATDVYSDEDLKKAQSTTFDLDTERPTSIGLDDTFRPTLDSPAMAFEDNLPLEPPKDKVTYEELRKKNREEYLKRSQNPFNRPIPAEAPPVIRATERPVEDVEQLERPKVKNRYGDVWQ